MNVEIYGKQSCGYCVQAKRICESNGLTYDYFDVVLNPAHRAELASKMPIPLKSVPQIFIDGRYIPDGYKGLVKFVQDLP